MWICFNWSLTHHFKVNLLICSSLTERKKKISIEFCLINCDYSGKIRKDTKSETENWKKTEGRSGEVRKMQMTVWSEMMNWNDRRICRVEMRNREGQGEAYGIEVITITHLDPRNIQCRNIHDKISIIMQMGRQSTNQFPKFMLLQLG